MTKQVLFVQGAGDGAYKEDEELVDNLRQALGPEYDVRYPLMPDEGSAPYQQWKQQIQKELTAMRGPLVLIGHSVGASVLLKCLSEINEKRPIVGIFLIAAPFWGGDGWRYEGYEELELPKNVAASLPSEANVSFYHCRDDEIAPFNHLALFAKLLPQAKTTQIDKGGHQFNNDLSVIAQDIKNLG